MVDGRIVAEGTPTGIKAQQGGTLIELLTDKPQPAANLLKREMDRWRLSLFGDRLHVVVEESVDSAIKNISERLSSAGIQVIRAYEQTLSLEDVFIATVEKMQNDNGREE
jgi:ABC-2 type transport system ATP-binding protein